MLDAANVLMNNYQLVAARTQSLNPTAATARPAPTETAPPNEPSTLDPAAASNISATSTAETDDIPSTSATLVAAASAATSLDSAKAEVSETAKQNHTAETPVAKHNQVTIEDLGGEDHIDVQTPTTSTAATASLTTSIDHTSDHINELRKRRLKFLEEHNKTTTE